jgi:Flp pilus assembly protein TadB
VGGIVLLIVGFTTHPSGTGTLRAPLHRRLALAWAGLPRQRQLLIAAACVLGLLAAVFTGFLILAPVVAALASGVPLLLARPRNRDIELLEALDRWVRGLLACLPTGKSVADAIRATRRQAPPALAPQIMLLTQRLDEQWTLSDALLGFAADCDAAEVDEVCAALIVAGRRGGNGVSASLEALADSVQDRLNAAREIDLERDKPRVVVRQVTAVIVVVAGLAMLTSPDYFAAYRTGIGTMILIALIATYLAVLAKLRTAGRSVPRQRILGTRQSTLAGSAVG